jgi:hypothetical protein
VLLLLLLLLLLFGCCPCCVASAWVLGDGLPRPSLWWLCVRSLVAAQQCGKCGAGLCLDFQLRKQSGLRVHPLSQLCKSCDIWQHISNVAHPIVAMHEISTSSVVALYSLAATKQSGLRVHPLSQLCKYCDTWQYISHVAPPHRRHPLALYQLSGSSVLAGSHQAEWIACPPVVPALQIMRYLAKN